MPRGAVARRRAKSESSEPPRKAREGLNYVPCPANVEKGIHPVPVAIRLRRGPKGCAFGRCFCGSTLFLSPAWQNDYGISAERAQELGLMVVQ